MSYTAVVAGIKERLETVSGLEMVLDYEPASIQRLPAAYIIIDEYEDVTAMAVTAARYIVIIRLCIRWQDNEKAERELMPFVNSIPAAFTGYDALNRPNEQLGGRINSGLAEIVRAKAGWVPIGGTIYRILDFYMRVTDK